MGILDEVLARIILSSAEVIQSIQAKLDDLSIRDWFVDDCEILDDGSIDVVFKSIDQELQVVTFMVDDGEFIAIVQDEYEGDDEDDDLLAVDFTDDGPGMIMHDGVSYVNLANTSWMTKRFFAEILGGDIDPSVQTELDAYGYEYLNLVESTDEGRVVYRVIGGKKKRTTTAKKVRRQRLTGKQKAAIRKAVRKRKAKRVQTSRKLKRSLKIRKRMKIKTPKLNPRQKVAGTRDYKPGERVRRK